MVVQASTSGIERVLPEIYKAIETFSHEMGLITIIEAPSSKSRTLEGLKVSEKTIVKGSATGLESCVIRLHHDLTLKCDLLHGQKTGFFLDQQGNAGLLRGLVHSQFAKLERPVRVLDICCYVGQWAAHVTHALQQVDVEVSVTLFDTSATALEFASQNLRALEAEVETIQGDAMTGVANLPEGQFDVVICDPPAFVKKRADHAVGIKAYAKLNRDAMRTLSPGGLLVASSCSGLVNALDWQDILVAAGQKAGRMFKQLAKGGHAPDHFVRPEFPEGEYLKCVIGRIDYPY